jgi:hypothetical protein
LLRDASEINGDNLNSIKLETSKHFRNKKREYLKEKLDELATNNKKKNIRDLCRGINCYKRGHQPGSNLVKDENGDLPCRFPQYSETMEELLLSVIECT